MPVVWDDTEILRVIDEARRNNTGIAANGMTLMQQIAGRHGYQLDPNVDYGAFVRELLLARDAGLLTYNEIVWIGQPPDPRDPNMYLQRIQEIDVTTPGRDRAEGREFRREPPDPAEDDGRLIRS